MIAKDKDKTYPPGSRLFKCKRCKDIYLTYMSYPGICDKELCYEKGKERLNKR